MNQAIDINDIIAAAEQELASNPGPQRYKLLAGDSGHDNTFTAADGFAAAESAASFYAEVYGGGVAPEISLWKDGYHLDGTNWVVTEADPED